MDMNNLIRLIIKQHVWAKRQKEQERNCNICISGTDLLDFMVVKLSGVDN
jgi:hypothetical protein